MPKLGNILKMILFIVILPTFAYFGSGDTILDNWQEDGYIGAKINLDAMKQILLVLSVLIPSVFLTFQNEWLTRRNKTVESQRSLLLNLIRTGTLSYFQSQIGSPDLSSTRIRLFVLRKRLRIIKWWKIVREYHMVKKHVDGLCTPDRSNGLEFNLNQGLHGVVQICFEQKEITYEDSAAAILNSNDLNTYQKVAYTGISFWLCSPIINEKGEVAAILSFESIHSIDIASDDDLSFATAVIMTNFSKDLYDNCPEIFK